MSTPPYKLRPRNNIIDYRRSPRQSINVTNLSTEYINPPILLGEETDILEHVYRRHSGDILDNIKNFLYNYKHPLYDFHRIIRDMNEEPCPVDSQGREAYIIQKHTEIHYFVNNFFVVCYANYKHVDINEDNLEEYLQCIRYGMLVKDWILLTIKIQIFYKVRINQDNYKLYYDLCNFDKKHIQTKYKEYKKREYDKQKIPLLYSTKLPNDICNYIIKEFL